MYYIAAVDRLAVRRHFAAFVQIRMQVHLLPRTINFRNADNPEPMGPSTTNQISC